MENQRLEAARAHGPRKPGQLWGRTGTLAAMDVIEPASDVKGQCIPMLVIFTQWAKISWHVLLATEDIRLSFI